MSGEKYHDIQQTNCLETVSLTGYRWIDKPGMMYVRGGKPSKEQPPVLIPLPGPDGTANPYFWSRAYDPLEDEPTLFQKFADVKPTKEDILAFANEYGCITGNIFIHEKKDQGPPIKTDSLETWVREISEIKEVLDLWYTLLAAQGKDVGSAGMTDAQAVESLKKSIKLMPGPRDARFHQFESKNKRLRKAVAFLDGESVDIVDAAKYFVAHCVNEKLKENKVTPELVSEDDLGLVPYLVPENLLAAIWLQLYLWIAGDKSYKRCPVCGFWADTTGLRSDWKEHRECGARRRAKESYERKKKAATGKTKKRR